MSPFRILLSLTALAAAAAMSLPARAEQVFGLTTTNALVIFDSATPMRASTPFTITGLSPGERMLSIDLQLRTGFLYGVGSDDRVYRSNINGAAFTAVGTLSTPLGSDVVGIDFDPVADLSGAASLRIVSSTGQNLLFNVATGATTVQTPIQTSFSAIAYANNDRNPATGTALYYIDTAADVLRVAAGAFDNPTITTVGPLGFDVNGVAGFDIGFNGIGFVALTDADIGKSGLYTVNLATGATSLVGAFGIGGNTLIAPLLLGLTIVPIPEPGTCALMLAGVAAVGFMARQRRAG